MKKVIPLMRNMGPTLAAGTIAGVAVLAGILAGAYDGQLLAIASAAGIALALSFELALWSWPLPGQDARDDGASTAQRAASVAQPRERRTGARRFALRPAMQRRTA